MGPAIFILLRTSFHHLGLWEIISSLAQRLKVVPSAIARDTT